MSWIAESIIFRLSFAFYCQMQIYSVLTSYQPWNKSSICLLYTSDAADEEDSVDLGGRRIIKKKKNRQVDYEVDKLKNTEKSQQ